MEKSRKILVLVLVVLFSFGVFVACNTAKKKTDLTTAKETHRNTASVNFTNVDPVSGKTFWEEIESKHLGLEKLGLFKKWARANPLAAFADLRSHQPIWVLPSIIINKPVDYPNKGTVVVSLYQDVFEILSQPKKFSVRNYTWKMESSVGPFMLAYDEKKPYNTDEKPWMRTVITPDDMPRIREMVKKLSARALNDGTFIDQHLDGSSFGRLEVVNQLARKVPIFLTGEYFGFPGPDLESMYRWSRATQYDFFHNVPNDKKVHEDSVRAGHEMKEYLKGLVAQRRGEISKGSSRDDVLSRLIKKGIPESEFSDDRIGTNIIGTLIGGVETTQAAIVQALEQLMLRPEQFEGARQAALAGDDVTLSKYVWEALRFNPVNPFVVRYAEEDYTLGRGTDRETLIKKGSLVLVGTQSAMFDDKVVPEPMEFSLNRPDSVYFHLGFGHHRCLGDYVSEVQVPEIIKSLLVKKNLHLASGFDGQVDKGRVADKLGPVKIGLDLGPFPEKFVVEFDVDGPAKYKQIADPYHAYEDYLKDFSREDYKTCLSGSGYHNVPGNVLKHNIGDADKALFWCRLKKEFRSCMTWKGSNLIYLLPGKVHDDALNKCEQTNPLTAAEKMFYDNIILGKSIDLSKVPTNQAQRTNGPDWTFEDHLKFYNRYTFRECFLDPLGFSSFPDARQWLFYARLNLPFRMCMGPKILAYEHSGGRLGKPREEMLKECENGKYDEVSGRLEGGLSKIEKYYYHTIILGEKLSSEEDVRD